MNYKIAREMFEPTEFPANVIPLRRADREIATLANARSIAWAEFQRATREMVDAQNRMHDAHRRWLDLDIRLFAVNAAEKIDG